MMKAVEKSQSWRCLVRPPEIEAEGQQREIQIETSKSRVEMGRQHSLAASARVASARRRVAECRTRIRRLDAIVRYGWMVI